MWRRHRGRLILSGILIVAGLVWIGQGTGLLQGRSFMVDDVRWAIAGGAFVAIGLALLAASRQRSS
jgi:hypothetical protein